MRQRKKTPGSLRKQPHPASVGPQDEPTPLDSGQPRHRHVAIRWLYDARFYCLIALFLSLACLYQRLALLSDAPPWINSDTLWPVNLIIDLFVDKYHLNGWQFSIAPCWFPDVFLV